MKPLRRFTVRPELPETLAPLRTLVNNLRWTWHRPTRALFASIDPRLWEAVHHNPLRLLGEVPAARVEELAADPDFLDRLGAAEADLKQYMEAPGWYQSLADAPRAIAYFSPEFGLTEAMPQYSGGLGVLAGDHLKTASDLGLPLVGVGLFYRMGYFQQFISSDGRQQEHYPVADPRDLPLELLHGPDGAELRIQIPLPDGPMSARLWRAQVGRISLLLLDSLVEENSPEIQQITDQLYGGGSENRLRQEILLGIGGVKALSAVGIDPEVFHTNEGHAGFLGLERVRRLVEDDGLDVATAIETVRSGTVFTTHTPVAAGIDRFARHLIERYFGPEGVPTGLSVEELMTLGGDQGDGSVFNMAVMGLRLAQRANGVSALHGQVSREIFAWLWPGFDTEEVPIAHVTNGVHAGTWIRTRWQEFYERELGPDYAEQSDWGRIGEVPDEVIWELRSRARQSLIEQVRRRLRQAWLERGMSEGQLGWIERAFDPGALTIGFARRVPSYKRLTLILRDRDRLKRLLLDPERPLQLLLAGKAHPADEGGKALIHEFASFAADPEVRHRVAFLPDYDMALGRALTGGCDVWLNNPLRPYEACGTSGMKAALNGCLNLSIRDGWWDELYDGNNGWAIPSVDDGSVDPERRDEFESQAIFDLLERNVVPLFYERKADDLPAGWVDMIKHCLVSLGPEVTASRMVRDYTEQLYVPAANASRAVRADGFAAAREQVAWRERVAKQWPEVRIEQVEDFEEDYRLGAKLPIRAVVSLGTLSPEDVQVEAAFGRIGTDDELPDAKFVPLRARERSQGAWIFEGELPLTNSGAFGFTVRVVPHLSEATKPAELGLVTWAS